MTDPRQIAIDMMSLLIRNLDAGVAYDKIVRAVRRADGDAVAAIQYLADDAERFLSSKEEAGR